MRIAERSVSKQGHLQPSLHSWPGNYKRTIVKWPKFYSTFTNYLTFKDVDGYNNWPNSIIIQVTGYRSNVNSG